MKTTNVSLKFPTQFSKYINNVKQLNFEGNSFSDLVNELDATYGNVSERLFESDGEVRPYINIFIGKKNIESLNGLDSTINDGDQISLLLSRAGG
ncbi:MoaD/ThiS family protein [Ascidiimonas sp. W6]|uniref:MoaD/ThiS family protein n=1 Tax=Ascidiimonas meishanensis TaxID=3128903 RepID=UPI0030ED96AE